MTQPRYRVRVTLTANNQNLVTSERLRAVYRGDDYYGTLSITDEAGTPFNLSYGNPGVLNWTIRAALRPSVVVRGGELLAAATCSASDLTGGVVAFWFAKEDTAAIYVDRGEFDLEIENLTDSRFAVGRTFTTHGGPFEAYGDVSRSADLEPSEPAVSSSGSGDALTGLANLLSTGAATPAETEHGIHKETVSNVAYLRSLTGTLGLRARQIGESIRIERRPSLLAPYQMRPQLRYRPVRLLGRKTAGAADDPTLSTCSAVHGTNHGYPWQVWTATDANGHPHEGHQYIIDSATQGTDTGIRGATTGYLITRGDFVRGAKLSWDLFGMAQNVGKLDAFWDFALDINPRVAASVYDDTYRMRMVSPELGVIWAGEIPWKAHIELFPIDATTCAWWAEFKVFDSTGSLLLEWDTGSISGHSFNWLTTDAEIMLRWHVDKDLANQLDVFDDSFQGTNQSTDYLRCHIDRYEMTPSGFGE